MVNKKKNFQINQTPRSAERLEKMGGGRGEHEPIVFNNVGGGSKRQKKERGMAKLGGVGERFDTFTAGLVLPITSWGGEKSASGGFFPVRPACSGDLKGRRGGEDGLAAGKLNEEKTTAHYRVLRH